VRYSGWTGEYVRKYAGAARRAHEGFVCDEPTVPCMPRPNLSVPPGRQGCQDVASLVRASVSAGAVWLVVEQDFPSSASGGRNVQPHFARAALNA
jgi:hypothetical protein